MSEIVLILGFALAFAGYGLLTRGRDGGGCESCSAGCGDDACAGADMKECVRHDRP
ncbi:MAG: hypothetical protein JSU87_17030 [Gemmatimonadota bacterium]|nr:MAG: hypothetical protein JSU87_17030 [Gemmatimonadota bacterium]